MKRSTLLCFVCASLLFTGCYTLDKSLTDNPSLRVPSAPFNMQMAAEVAEFRIDLVRQTHMETESDASGTGTHTSTENIPYHPLGVYLGEGVFVDVNNNLSINVLALLEEQLPNKCAITEQERNWVRSRRILEMNGDSWTLSTPGFFSKQITDIHLSDTLIWIGRSFMTAKQSVSLHNKALEYRYHGLLGRLSRTSIEVTDNGYVSPRIGRDLIFEQVGVDTIEMGSRLKVIRYNDRWEFIYGGFLGLTETYTFLKIDNGYVFFDQHARGKLITIDDDGVKVEENGKLKRIYRIEAL